jgi:hypothetical protein
VEPGTNWNRFRPSVFEQAREYPVIRPKSEANLGYTDSEVLKRLPITRFLLIKRPVLTYVGGDMLIIPDGILSARQHSLAHPSVVKAPNFSRGDFLG